MYKETKINKMVKDFVFFTLNKDFGKMITLEEAKNDPKKMRDVHNIIECKYSSTFNFYQTWYYIKQYTKDIQTSFTKEFEICDKKIKVNVSYDNNTFNVTTIPSIGTLLKRKSKYNPETIRLEAEYVLLEIQTDISKIVWEANKVWKKRFFDFVDETLTEEDKKISLVKYDYYNAEDKKQWLIDNGFTGVEKYGYLKEEKMRCGNSRGITYEIDFKNKEVITRGYTTY